MLEIIYYGASNSVMSSCHRLDFHLAIQLQWCVKELIPLIMCHDFALNQANLLYFLIILKKHYGLQKQSVKSALDIFAFF